MKSDDVIGRVKTYESIIKGTNIPKPGIPESFKVLMKEMQSLGLDVRVLDENRNEVQLKETVDYGETDLRAVIEGDMRQRRNDEDFASAGFTRQRWTDDEQLEDEEDDDRGFDPDLDDYDEDAAEEE